MYRIIENFVTRNFGFGPAVGLLSAGVGGLLTILHLLYLIPKLQGSFDFTSEFYVFLSLLLILPWPTGFFLYGGFTRLGLPAVYQHFRTVNKYIIADKSVDIKEDLTGEEYVTLLKSINRLPKIIFLTALFDDTYICLAALLYFIFTGSSISTLAWVPVSWLITFTLYCGVSSILAEVVTGDIRMKCKIRLRELDFSYELETYSTIRFKILIISLLFLFCMVLSNTYIYFNHDNLNDVLFYVIIVFITVMCLIFLTVKFVLQIITDTKKVIQSLQRGESTIVNSPAMDREIVGLTDEINSVVNTISTLSKKSDRLKSIIKKFKTENAKPEPRDMIVELIEYLDKHYSDTYNRKELAQRFCINDDYMCSLFKKMTGSTISNYINLKRIEVAKQLILDTDNRIIDIAFRVGFDNLAYFYRLFKKMTGITPGEFKDTMTGSGLN